jgi:TIR domain
LSDRGWGEFAIAAHVSTKTGEAIPLEHWIEFKQPGKTVESGRKPSVFLSFSAMDRQIVRFLKNSLENQGIEVLSPEGFEPGDSWRSMLTEGISRAQVVAFLVSGELRGFAEQELAFAKQGNKSVVPILVGEASNVPQAFEQVQAMHMRSQRDVGPVADLLAARAKNLFYEDEKRSL